MSVAIMKIKGQHVSLTYEEEIDLMIEYLKARKSRKKRLDDFKACAHARDQKNNAANANAKAKAKAKRKAKMKAKAIAKAARKTDTNVDVLELERRMNKMKVLDDFKGRVHAVLG